MLEIEHYARHLAKCVASAAGQPDPLVALDGLHTIDLYLACASGRGVPGARELLIHRFLPSISGAVQVIDDSPAFVDEVRQALAERLLLATDGSPRILGYGGRAALATWMSVAAQKLALGMLRSEGAQRRAAQRAADEPLPSEPDPEMEYLKERYREDFKAALSTALAGLPDRQRTLVRLHTVSGLTMARIAIMFAVDESTVSRWIERARAIIRSEAQAQLEKRLGVSASEIPSLARLVTSQLDVSVARLLADEIPTVRASR